MVDEHITALQVMVNHIQTNAILAGLNINWPPTLRTVQNGLNIVAASVVSGVSMDCSLPAWDSPWISSNEFETLLSILVPIGMMMLFVLLWTLRSASALANCFQLP